MALRGDRSPYDEATVSEDLPNLPVVETVRSLIYSGARPVFMSGRSEVCRAATEKWLAEHVLQRASWSDDAELHMRAVGDRRPDHVVKLELFDRYVRDRYTVRLAIDDRDQVVKLWRSLGLTCLQVADGNF